VKLALNGRGGKVGRVLAPALEANGHELVELDSAEAMVDFTAPEPSRETSRSARARRSLRDRDERLRPAARRRLARERGVACFHAPNFALGAVLMMRFARGSRRAHAARRDHRAAQRGEAGRTVGHGEGDRGAARDDPADPLGPPARPRRTSGGLFGGEGQLLTIRHDTFSREAFVPASCSRSRSCRPCPPG
jgi:4-hydroxy-tetrahydrodipicolinate reductase